MTRHIKEAIQLNTKRMPLYAELSDGDTVPYSKRLIRAEKLILLGSWYYDKIGNRFQEQGIPFIKSEFVEMSLTPSFSNQYPEGVRYDVPLEKFDLNTFKKQISTAYKQRDYKGLLDICHHELENLETQLHVYCMLRHMIESMRRVAFLIPTHHQKAQALGIQSPEKYSRQILLSHYYLLSFCRQFDEEIAPIQNRGIPFIYQDLPKIGLE